MKTVRKLLYDNTGSFRFAILADPLFLAGLLLKLGAMGIFAGTQLRTEFIPFAKHNIFTAENSFTYFYTLGIETAFPYPEAMRFFFTLPGDIFSFLLHPDVFTVTYTDIFIFHLPILAADILLLLIFARLLRRHETAILVLYWLSPILFYINYIHGQLDVMPIALLFLSLALLFKGRTLLSVITFGVAMATKHHIAILLPLLVLTIWRKDNSFVSAVRAGTLALGTFLLINAEALISPAFREMVFHNSEQIKILDLTLTLGERHIYIAPFVYVAIMLHALTYRFIGRDVCIMFSGFLLGSIIVLIPPMPGWYYWIIPFLIYFGIKERTFSRANFFLLNIGYFAYIFTSPLHSPIPYLQHLPNPLLHNLSLTFLQAVLLFNIIWLFQRGVAANRQKKLVNAPFIIGVSGDSGSGKTTFTTMVQKIIGKDDFTHLPGDALHKWERGDYHWQQFTHLDPRANNLHNDTGIIKTLKNGFMTHRHEYDHHSGRFTKPKQLHPKRIILLEGLHSFYLPAMRSALDLRIFIKPDETLRRNWKITRDTTERGYTEKKILEQIESRASDSNSHINPQESYADIVFSYCNSGESLRIVAQNTFDVECLIKSLELIEEEYELNYSPTATILTLHAKPKLDKIQQASYVLIPELYEIVNKPIWEDGQNGIIQLFTFIHIFHTLKIQ